MDRPIYCFSIHTNNSKGFYTGATSPIHTQKMHTHSCTNTKLCREHGVECLAQVHVKVWKEKAGIERRTLQLQNNLSTYVRKTSLKVSIVLLLPYNYVLLCVVLLYNVQVKHVKFEGCYMTKNKINKGYVYFWKAFSVWTAHFLFLFCLCLQ